MELNDELFERLDQNSDGKITAEELVILFQNLGQNVSENEAEQMIKDVNRQKNYITFEQFAKISEDLETVFQLLDIDGDGQISAAEFRHRLNDFNLQGSDSQIEELIVRADTDGNGKLSVYELIRVLKKQADTSPKEKIFKKMIEGRNTGVSSLWKGVNHIALVVSDVGRSVAFYGGVLGMKQVMRPDFDRHGAWFTLGNIDLHLIHGRPAVHPDDDLMVSHIALNCGDDEDVTKLMNKLKTMNVPFRENISVPNPRTKKQVKQAFVQDPDGYYLEFCSCNSLEELLREKLELDKKLWNLNRLKAAMALQSQMRDLLKIDPAKAEEKSTIYAKKCATAKAIKLYGGVLCQNITESDIANISSKFDSTAAILSIIKERENISVFKNCLKNKNTANLKLILDAASGNLDSLRKASQEGLDLNNVDNDQRTCLHLAATNGNLDCVSFLVEDCMVDKTTKDAWGLSPLQCALEYNHSEVGQFLENNKSDVKKTDQMTNNEEEEIRDEILDWINKTEITIQVDDSKFANLLGRQQTYGDILQNATKEEVEVLLRMFNNHVPHVILALKEKIMAKGCQVFSPPAFYERDGTLFQPQTFQMRVENHGSDKTQKCAEVMAAASSGDLSAIISAYGDAVDLNIPDYDKRTALHRACMGRKMDCIHFLVEVARVALEPQDRWGLTPLDYAKQNGDMELIEILCEKKNKSFQSN